MASGENDTQTPKTAPENFLAKFWPRFVELEHEVGRLRTDLINAGRGWEQALIDRADLEATIAAQDARIAGLVAALRYYCPHRVGWHIANPRCSGGRLSLAGVKVLGEADAAAAETPEKKS